MAAALVGSLTNTLTGVIIIIISHCHSQCTYTHVVIPVARPSLTHRNNTSTQFLFMQSSDVTFLCNSNTLLPYFCKTVYFWGSNELNLFPLCCLNQPFVLYSV